MLLEYILDYRSSSLVYERIFLRTLKALELEGKLIRDKFILKLYVDADEVEKLEAFATLFSSSLPHSIFLYSTEANIVENASEDSLEISKESKLPLPFCPKCLGEVMNSEHSNYYNIFTECEVCGYGVKGESKSYKEEFEKAASWIKEGKIVEINTFYGNYFLGLPSKKPNSVTCDMLVYDLVTVEEYAYAKKYEITSLGVMEKPFIKLKKKKKFLMDFENIEEDLIRFKLPDDFILHLLMEEVYKLGVKILFMTSEAIQSDEKLCLVEPENRLEPIEVVASENDIAIVEGEKGLPEFPITSETVNPVTGSFYSVIREHYLQDEIVAGINLSKKYKNNIMVYGKKFGTVEYLSFGFTFNSMEEIFKTIIATNETGVKIVENYKNKFPEHFANISQIIFEDKEFNLYRLWGIVSIVLDFTKTEDPLRAAEVLEESAMTFLGEKGPRIDYKLLKRDHKVYLDPLMTIRTAMSFKLAGVDQLTLAYGVIESFLEFIANELDEMKQNMNISAVAVTGSLLGNRHIFSKMSKEISVNHNIYFNNQLPVEGLSMFYGGEDLNI